MRLAIGVVAAHIPPVFINLNKMNAPTTTFPFSPLRTLFFNAGHQSWIEIRVQVIVNYRIFLAAPVSFHDRGSALVVKE